MTAKLHSFFKVTTGTKLMSFGERSNSMFNYVDFADPQKNYLDNSARIQKQMNDSCLLEINFDPKYTGHVRELKLTNQDILTWEDYWLDVKSNLITDPLIEKLNLQKNKLIHVNFNLPRKNLKHLNLEGNENLRAVFIYESPNLEVLNLSSCPGLEVINLGLNKSIKALLARNCNLAPTAQERLLRDFTPTKTASMNRSFAMFRKEYETILDLRGNTIDWGNRRIVSKIRLLLCNNWMVLWDNVPPASVIPPQMYAFFSTNLEDKLIKDYYG